MRNSPPPLTLAPLGDNTGSWVISPARKGSKGHFRLQADTTRSRGTGAGKGGEGKMGQGPKCTGQREGARARTESRQDSSRGCTSCFARGSTVSGRGQALRGAPPRRQEEWSAWSVRASAGSRETDCHTVCQCYLTRRELHLRSARPEGSLRRTPCGLAHFPRPGQASHGLLGRTLSPERQSAWAPVPCARAP